jgi:two-component sensor histidine kinase
MNVLLKTRPELQTKNRGGAPKANRNAFKTGRHTADRRAFWARIRALKRRVKNTLAEVNAQLDAQER